MKGIPSHADRSRRLLGILALGWTSLGIVGCGDGGPAQPATNRQAITGGAEDLTPGSVILKKVNRPGDADQSIGAYFEHTIVGTGPDSPASTGPGGDLVWNDVAPGTYSITEIGSGPSPSPELDPFVLGDLVCDDSGSATPSQADLEAKTATIEVDPGETVTCTFYNDFKGRIVVEKVNRPADADPSIGAYFEHTVPGGATGGDAFALPGAALVFDNVAPGAYTVTEIGSRQTPSPELDPFVLGDLVCDDGGSATPSLADLGSKTASIGLDPGETVTCTFYNDFKGTIVVRKVNRGDDANQTIGAYFEHTVPGGRTGPDAFAAPGGDLVFENVAPGTYGITEIGTGLTPTPELDPFVLGDLQCDDDESPTPSVEDVASRTATVGLDAGETVTCTFFNDFIQESLPPTILEIQGPAEPVAVGTPVTLSAVFIDPDDTDNEVLIDWGDGEQTSRSTSVATSNSEVAAEETHAYAAPGVYEVTLAVEDDDGGRDEAGLAQFVVVFDPTGGFVTGGGWIDSPVGACTYTGCAPDGSTVGKASFGFASRYRKGAGVPDGRTEFQFRAGELNFRSTAYEWLVVAGSRAQFKGTGTLNGTGDYGFLITAIDGGSGASSTDGFRIKLVDRTTDTVIYDNQRGADDAGNAATALGGGSVIVHNR